MVLFLFLCIIIKMLTKRDESRSRHSVVTRGDQSVLTNCEMLCIVHGQGSR